MPILTKGVTMKTRLSENREMQKWIKSHEPLVTSDKILHPYLRHTVGINEHAGKRVETTTRPARSTRGLRDGC